MLILSYEIAESRLRNIMLQNLNGDTSQLGKNMSRLMIKVSAVHATDRQGPSASSCGLRKTLIRLGG